ncbi:MAG: hypothetical protein M1834_008995 [Cirrosporium novae-zelandiae]|nr:MAG: hypothetical protein M1834_008995 [Cirrosporium novae-zelandiae]
MSLVPSDRTFFHPPRNKHAEERDSLPSAPDVITTPCDPWPRPYYLKDGFRRVQPYHYTYNTYCKQRWRGKEVLEIFSKEFRDRPKEYYKEAIETGMVTLNGKRIPSIHSIVQNGDVISHTMHRHEPPVTGQPIGIVHEDNDFIVINKPSGIPVHPAGRYNYNSIIEILRAERGFMFNPLPCHRLDRLTSGIMFIGKHGAAAERMSEEIRGREVKKEYVARVRGEFPDGEVVCDQPILSISPILGLNRARANGKEARTVFRRLAYYPPKEKREKFDASKDVDATEDADGKGPPAPETPDDTLPNPDTTNIDLDKTPWKAYSGYSIVHCLPLTGRTHQIRVHLQFLGHPISNDPIYSNQRVFGPDLGAFDDSGDQDETIIQRLSKMGKTEEADAIAYHEEMRDDYERRKAEKLSGEVCEICDTELYSDPGVHELGIYLHALRYAKDDGNWSYETGLPKWAMPPPGCDGPMTIPKGAREKMEKKAHEVEAAVSETKRAHGIIDSDEETEQTHQRVVLEQEKRRTEKEKKKAEKKAARIIKKRARKETERLAFFERQKAGEKMGERVDRTVNGIGGKMEGGIKRGSEKLIVEEDADRVLEKKQKEKRIDGPGYVDEVLQGMGELMREDMGK